MQSADREAWRRLLRRANAAHVRALQTDLRREFLRVADDWRQFRSVERHRGRLALILAAHAIRTDRTFNALAEAMLARQRPAETKQEPPPATEARVLAVLTAVAGLVVGARLAAAAAARLAASPAIKAAAEAAVRSAAPDATAAAIAADLVRQQSFQQAVLAETAVLAAEAGEGVGDPPQPPRRRPGRPRPPEGPEAFTQRVARYVRVYAPLRAMKIASTTRGLITRTLAKAALDGASEEEIAKRLEALGREGVTLGRARRIARTEIGAAQNAAILRNPDGSRRRCWKIWASIDDAARRPTHGEAEGQRRRFDEPFRVGGALLDHPGDPKGPLGEIVNCRCGMILEPLDEP